MNILRNCKSLWGQLIFLLWRIILHFNCLAWHRFTLEEKKILINWCTLEYRIQYQIKNYSSFDSREWLRNLIQCKFLNNYSSLQIIFYSQWPQNSWFSLQLNRYYLWFVVYVEMNIAGAGENTNCMIQSTIKSIVYKLVTLQQQSCKICFVQRFFLHSNEMNVLINCREKETAYQKPNHT